MKKEDLAKWTVGEIVAADFRAAAVFKSAGIDFCCGGRKGLVESCREKNIDPAKVEQELTALEAEPVAPSLRFRDWDLGFLCDYIVNTHHQYVKATLPELAFYTQKIAQVHGEHHPELLEIADLTAKVVEELTQHLRNEEEVLFPAIREALKDPESGARNVILAEISRMGGEHEFAGGAMDHIAVISNHYQVPADGCNTYAVAYKLLNEFEDDLHVHVHLENNILFPKALAL